MSWTMIFMYALGDVSADAGSSQFVPVCDRPSRTQHARPRQPAAHSPYPPNRQRRALVAEVHAIDACAGAPASGACGGRSGYP